MDLARTDDAPQDTRLDDALARLKTGDGEPLPVMAGSKLVAYLLTPEEFERMEDERDLAILRACKAEDDASGEPRVTLQDLAHRHGVDLTVE